MSYITQEGLSFSAREYSGVDSLDLVNDNYHDIVRELQDNGNFMTMDAGCRPASTPVDPPKSDTVESTEPAGNQPQ